MDACRVIAPGWREAVLTSFCRTAFAATLLPWFAISALSRFPGHDLSMGPAVDGWFVTLGAVYAYLPDTVASGQAMPGTAAMAYVTGMSLTELVLPLLVVAGLAARWAAVGLALHQVLVQAILAPSGWAGALFDASPFDVMPDQLLLWCALLAPVMIHGAGPLSLDAGLRRLFQARA